MVRAVARRRPEGSAVAEHVQDRRPVMAGAVSGRCVGCELSVPGSAQWMGHDRPRDPDKKQGARRAGDRSTSHMGTCDWRLTSETPDTPFENVVSSEADDARYRSWGTERGDGEESGCQHQRPVPGRAIIGLNLRFIRDIVGEPTQRRQPEQCTREESQERKAKRVTTRDMRPLVRQDRRELRRRQPFRQLGGDIHAGLDETCRERGVRQPCDHANRVSREARSTSRDGEGVPLCRVGRVEVSENATHLPPCPESVPCGVEKTRNNEEMDEAVDRRQQHVQRHQAQGSDVIRVSQQRLCALRHVVSKHRTDAEKQQRADGPQQAAAMLLLARDHGCTDSDGHGATLIAARAAFVG